MRPLYRLVRLGATCLASGFCLFFMKDMFTGFHMASVEWPSDVKEQVELKRLALDPGNKVDSAMLYSGLDGARRRLWLLMCKKDCRLLGQLADRHHSVEVSKVPRSTALALFPLLACPRLPAGVKDLVNEQVTFGLLKPDLVQRGLVPDVLRLIEEKHLRVLSAATVTFTPELARDFYAEHAHRPFFRELTEYMASGPSVALLMAGRDGVKRWRELMGPTDPAKAKGSAPKTIRAVYGLDGTRNSSHGSDSMAAAAREIAFACGHFDMPPHRATY